MSDIKFLVIGRTASGKTYLAHKAAEKLGMKVVKSFTTRPPRPGKEENGDHYFVDSKENNINAKDNIVAYTKINGYKYWSTKDELDRCDIYVIDPNGVEYLKNQCGDDYVFVEIYVVAPKKIRKRRYISRGGSWFGFIMRQIKENTQFTNYANNLKHDLLHWVVINGDNENGLNHFMDIIDCFTKMNNINYKIKE